MDNFRRIRPEVWSKKIIFHNGIFETIISIDNLFNAWHEFKKGKQSKDDVQEFAYNLEDNLFALYHDLRLGRYSHGSYQQFRISDPKPRIISKASVRDRLLHHAIYRILYPGFDKTFIYDSYSCRVHKGVHKAFARLTKIARKVSWGYTAPCWALKLDIRKFFDSVDHRILVSLLKERITDERLLNLLQDIISSFSVIDPSTLLRSAQDDKNGKGIPLGNLTSQLFANIYMDSLDKFVKHELKANHYLRYADDFILLDTNPDRLFGYLVEINRFLRDNLKLTLHPNKIILRKLSWGIDYVGYVALPYYSLPRRKTVWRIFRTLICDMKNNTDPDKLEQSLNSYLGYLQHVNAYNLSRELIGISSAISGNN